MHKAGVEPARPQRALAPEASESTNSTTCAYAYALVSDARANIPFQQEKVKSFSGIFPKNSLPDRSPGGVLKEKEEKRKRTNQLICFDLHTVYHLPDGDGEQKKKLL